VGFLADKVAKGQVFLQELLFSLVTAIPPVLHGPGVDSDPSENEYQEHFLGVKAAGA